MSTRSSVLKILADGRFHSGTEIGGALGISRAAVNKCINTLTGLGLEIHRVSGKGYRLLAAGGPLCVDTIRAHAGAATGPVLHLLDEVDSTSQFLWRMAETDTIAGRVCLAETQHQGRGRRGRAWMATPYSNLMLSMGWQFERGPAALTGLSLAAGVAAAQALNAYGAQGLGLKWPNDLLWGRRKLGGVLVDIRGEAAGPSRVVLGIGVNVRLGAVHGDAVDQPWVDLRAMTGDAQDRNRLAGLMVAALWDMFRRFEAEGFGPFRTAWDRLHAFAGQPVRLLQGDAEFHGDALGVDEQGALIVRDAAGAERRFHSGEVSLRPAP